MLSYPFDPQCRLSSNWIPDETVTAFISAKTRTIVPVHAPFFQNAIITKDGIELNEGIDFYFSLEHKVASAATCRGVYGGITLINDTIELPVTISYHPQGGSFEATYGQIFNYLETDPDIWDGSWEALINDYYYPPVNVLYDPEAFITEPAIIEACQLITTTINAKDEKVTLDFNILKTRIASLANDIKRLKVEEHTVAKGNVHNTKLWHIDALGANDMAANAAKLQGVAYNEFMDYVLGSLTKLDTLVTDFYQLNTALTTDAFLVDTSTLLLGDTTALILTKESVAEYDDGAVTLQADSECTNIGASVSLVAGNNNLVLTSSGSEQDQSSLTVNGEQVITTDTLTAMTMSLLYPEPTGLVTGNTSSLSFTGDGSLANPLECQHTPDAADTNKLGYVKLANAGITAGPGNGYVDPNVAFIYDPIEKRGIVLRNGTDEGPTGDINYYWNADKSDTYNLLNHVYIGWLDNSDDWQYTATYDVFQPASMPAGVIVNFVICSMDNLVYVNTTDGLYLLYTNNSIDYDNWIPIKILLDPSIGPFSGISSANNNYNRYGQTICMLYNNNIYIMVMSRMHLGLEIECFVAPWNGVNNSVVFQVAPFKYQPLGEYQYYNSNKIRITNDAATSRSKTTGEYLYPVKSALVDFTGDVKYYQMPYSPQQYNIAIVPPPAYDDPVDAVRSNNMVRICYRGTTFCYNQRGQRVNPLQLSVVFDLDAKTADIDNRNRYPATLKPDGSLSIKDNWLTGGKPAPYHNCVVRSNGYTFVYDTYDFNTIPTLTQVVSSDGSSDYDNIKSGKHNWTRKKTLSIENPNSVPVKSGFTGLSPIGKNRFIGINPDDTAFIAEYTTNTKYIGRGNYPIAGYGPSNNRQFIDLELYKSLKRMIVVNDGKKIFLEGVVLTDKKRGGYSTYNNDILGGWTYVDDAAWEALKTYVTKTKPNAPRGYIVTEFQLEISQRTNNLHVGSYTVTYPDDNRNSWTGFFTFSTNRSVGKITELAFVAELVSASPGTDFKEVSNGIETAKNQWINAKGDLIIDTDCSKDYLHVPNSLLIKSSSGDWYKISGSGTTIQQNFKYMAQSFSILQADKWFSAQYATACNIPSIDGWITTLEYGLGYIQRTQSGEAMYIESYGYDLNIYMLGPVQHSGPRYIALSTLSDAGPNIVASQQAVTALKDKIQQLVYPTRKVQNMDLTKDRIITRANIANADKVPNLSDADYPVSTKQLATLVDKALVNHSHASGDYIVTYADTDTTGYCLLGGPVSDPAMAAGPGMLNSLDIQAALLDNRAISVSVLDKSISIDSTL